MSAIRRARVTDILKVGAPEDATQSERDSAAKVIRCLRSYFRQFVFDATPRDGENLVTGGPRCLKCGKPLSGFLGTFQYGLVHGEGACSNCGWPARTVHRPTDSDGEEILRLSPYLLQYHPDVVEKAESDR